jgi:hypothetical protein
LSLEAFRGSNECRTADLYGTALNQALLVVCPGRIRKESKIDATRIGSEQIARYRIGRSLSVVENGKTLEGGYTHGQGTRMWLLHRPLPLFTHAF